MNTFTTTPFKLNKVSKFVEEIYYESKHSDAQNIHTSKIFIRLQHNVGELAYDATMDEYFDITVDIETRGYTDQILKFQNTHLLVK